MAEVKKAEEVKKATKKTAKKYKLFADYGDKYKCGDIVPLTSQEQKDLTGYIQEV